MIDELQAKYDRLLARRSNMLQSHDKAPDGSAQKVQLEFGLADVGKQIREVEKEIDAYLERT